MSDTAESGILVQEKQDPGAIAKLKNQRGTAKRRITITLQKAGFNCFAMWN